MSTNSKCCTLEELLPRVRELKRTGKRIVTYNGSFDILHLGHVRSIEEAKAQGDVLVMLLNSDVSIKKYKGPLRPVNPEKDRAEMIAALQSVDYVSLFDDVNPIAVLDRIKPDVHCNGADWGALCVERDTIEKNGGRLHLLTWTKGKSTTATLEGLAQRAARDAVRAVFLDRDGTINENKEGYVHTMEDVVFIPGVIDALRALSKTTYKIIIVTNQSGIGRGYYTESEFQEFTKRMLVHLECEGVRIDAVYHCPHLPADGCLCRKPGVDMFLRAVREHGISLTDSWMIGDDDADVAMGRFANVKTIKIGPRGTETRSAYTPHRYARDLKEAIDYIISFIL